MLLPVKWDRKKNELLKKQRGVCFEDVSNAIIENELLDIIPHHNSRKYPNQKVMIVRIREYVFYVPFIEEKNGIFLKTIIPSRKYNALYQPLTF